MFTKLKNKIADEVKANPRLQVKSFIIELTLLCNVLLRELWTR